MKRDVFQGLADPTRRAIIGKVVTDELSMTDVADSFDISRQAVSKHIKILTECGLITIEQKGRERYCKARPEKLREAAEWLEQYREFWGKRLDRLDDYLQKLQGKDKNDNRNPEK